MLIQLCYYCVTDCTGYCYSYIIIVPDCIGHWYSYIIVSQLVQDAGIAILLCQTVQDTGKATV